MLDKMNRKGKKANKKGFASEVHRSLNGYTMTMY